MDVEVTVAGDQTYEFTVTNETYSDLLEKIGLSPQEVSVLVDGKPVPEDKTVDAKSITVLRLIQGG
jgi:sulfur carrier protein